MKHELPKHSAVTLITNRRVSWRVRKTKLQNKAYYIRHVCVSVWQHVRALNRLSSKFSYNFSRHYGFGAGLAMLVQPLHYGLDDRGIRVRFPAKATHSLLQDVNFCGTMVTGGFSPGDESAEVWADRSSTFRADINNTRIFTSNPPHVFMT
jgi:hypothetical protein